MTEAETEALNVDQHAPLTVQERQQWEFLSSNMDTMVLIYSDQKDRS